MSRATAVFEEAFQAADELVAGGALGEASPGDDDAEALHAQDGEARGASTKTAG